MRDRGLGGSRRWPRAGTWRPPTTIYGEVPILGWLALVGVSIPSDERTGHAFSQSSEQFGASFAFDEVMAIDACSRPFQITGTLRQYSADAIIIATGSRARKLGLSSEEALTGRGVAYCAICDGAMFAGQRVAVVGGGDAAIQQALTLVNLGCTVDVIHRRDRLRASPGLRTAAEDHPDISMLQPYTVQEILGIE